MLPRFRATGPGNPITLIKNGTGIFVKGACNTARVETADVRAGQSVLHIVDAVLLPPLPAAP